MWNQASLLERVSRKRSVDKLNAQYLCWWDPWFLLDCLIMSFSRNCKVLMQFIYFSNLQPYTHFVSIIDFSCQETFTSLSAVCTVFLNFELHSTANHQTAHFHSRMSDDDDCKPWIGFSSVSLLGREAWVFFSKIMPCPSVMCFNKHLSLNMCSRLGQLQVFIAVITNYIDNSL